MGAFVNHRATIAAAWTVAVVIMGLNAWLVLITIKSWLV